MDMSVEASNQMARWVAIYDENQAQMSLLVVLNTNLDDYLKAENRRNSLILCYAMQKTHGID